jgi:glyoxylase-like metal-dependent hydrolase (beta-lactamase superfamily II)
MGTGRNELPIRRHISTERNEVSREVDVMNVPTMAAPRRVAADTEAFTAHYPLPGLGILPMNAFLIRAAEPVLVDAGIVSMAGEFLRHIAASIDLEDLRWIWLTHADSEAPIRRRSKR